MLDYQLLNRFKCKTFRKSKSMRIRKRKKVVTNFLVELVLHAAVDVGVIAHEDHLKGPPHPNDHCPALFGQGSTPHSWARLSTKGANLPVAACLSELFQFFFFMDLEKKKFKFTDYNFAIAILFQHRHRCNILANVLQVSPLSSLMHQFSMILLVEWINPMIE